MKSEKCIICGASGSGKDYLLRQLIKLGLKYSPKITTRPMRKMEKDGVDYNFMTNETFKNLLNENNIKTYQHFTVQDSDWYYAISEENFNENQLFIMTPHEISMISPEDRKKCFVVYLDIDETVRKNRIIKRNDNNDSITRRLEADKADFKDFSDYDLKITDPEFDSEMIYDLMF